VAIEDQFTLALFGSFNPAIVNERWLRRNTELLSDPASEFTSIEEDVSFVVFGLNDVHVEVTPERFLVNAARSGSSRAIALVRSVLSQLNHTPIETVGVYIERERSSDGTADDTMNRLVDRYDWLKAVGEQVGLRQLAVTLDLDEPFSGRVHIEDSMTEHGDVYFAVVLQRTLPEYLAPEEVIGEFDTTVEHLVRKADELLEGVQAWSSTHGT